MKTRPMCGSSIVGVFACMAMLAMAPQAQSAILAEFNAAMAGAGVSPNDVTPPWQYTSNGPGMLNNGSYLEQNFDSTQYGNYTFHALPAGTFNVGVNDYGLSVVMQPISNVTYGGSGYASIFMEWQDDQSYYGLTFWKDYGVTYGTGGGGLFAVDWSVAHEVYVGYNAVADTFSFYLDGTLKTTQSRTTFVLGTNFLGPNQMSFGDATTGGGASQAHWYSAAIYDSAVPVPEPASMALVAIGGALLGARFLRRRRA